MPDNLPAKPPLDRTAIERVLARATELQASNAGRDQSGMLTEAELIEIGKEAGISREVLTQALAEERSRVIVPEESGFVASITGPAVATASRTVRGSAADILATIDSWMQGEECLRVQRRFPDRITWERHDFSQSIPSGPFDLVSAQFLHSPVDDPRDPALRAAARAVAPGGTLLVVSHESVPWHPEVEFPTAQEVLDSLDIDPHAWTVERLDSRPRRVKRPDGDEVDVSDSVVRLRRC